MNVLRFGVVRLKARGAEALSAGEDRAMWDAYFECLVEAERPIDYNDCNEQGRRVALHIAAENAA